MSQGVIGCHTLYKVTRPKEEELEASILCHAVSCCVMLKVTRPKEEELEASDHRREGMDDVAHQERLVSPSHHSKVNRHVAGSRVQCLPSFVPSFLRSFLHSFLPSFLPSFLRSFLPSFLRARRARNPLDERPARHPHRLPLGCVHGSCCVMLCHAVSY